MTTNAFYERLHASGLSRWELGDLLGIHPHELNLADRTVSLNGQPVHVVAQLAARLDMHPADLADALDPVLTNHRHPGLQAAAETSVQDDAMVVLTALATTSVPLTLEELSIALTWPLDRADSAIRHAQNHPTLAGPTALRRVPPHRWTLTARLDILTPAQQRNLNETTHYQAPLSEEEATVLLTAYRAGNTPDYATWRQDHLATDHALKTSGLLQSNSGPHHATVHPDVRYSLDRVPDAP